MRYYPLSLASLVGIVAAFPAAAQTVSEPVLLEKIVVEGAAFQRDPDDLVQPVDVLRGAELNRKRKATLGELLEGEPGVSTSDFGPGVGRPIIRGQAGSRVLVLENGISTMDAASVSADHAVTLDTQAAEQIEIIKGPATLIYGSNASAGVVNVVDQRLPDTLRPGYSGEAEAVLGSNGGESTQRAHLDYGDDTAQVQFHADFSRREAGELFRIPGFSNTDPAGDGLPGRIPNSRVKTESNAVGFTRFGTRGQIGAAVSNFKTVYGIPSEEEAFIDLDQTRFDLKAGLNAPLPGFDTLRLRLGVNNYTHTEFEAPGEPGTVFNNDERELRAELRHRPLAGLHGVAGVQLNHRDFAAVGAEAFVPHTKTRQTGLFVIEEKNVGWGRLEGGLRIEQTAHEPVQPGLPNRDHTPVSVSLGALVNVSRDYHLRINLARSQRAPTAEETYAFGPHLATATFERGQSELDVETVHNVELGFDKHRGRWTFGASAYYQQIKDYVFLANTDCNRDPGDRSSTCAPDGTADRIAVSEAADPVTGEEVVTFAFDPAGELALVDYRQSDARFAGFEAETAYKLLTGATRLSLRAFGDVVRARLDDGSNLPRITPARYGIGVDTARGPVSAHASLTRTARQNRVAALETPSDRYTLLSADLGLKLPGALDATLFLRGRNLLDAEARRHTSFLKDRYALPGRSFFAGITLRWR